MEARMIQPNEIESLRQQLADIQAKYAAREQECRTAFGKEMELRKQLAECERERDEKDRQVTRLYAKFDAATKERDELAALNARMLVEYEARMKERDELKRDLDELLAALVECRSSVKFDLLHYEKVSRAYGNLGPEGMEKHEIAEAEANRLHKLIDTIDALAKVDADKMGDV